MAEIVELVVEDDRWQAVDLAALAERGVRLGLTAAGLAAPVEVAVLACDDARIAALNGRYRSNPRPTNVLSWPVLNLVPATPGALPPPPEAPVLAADPHLGDIALAYDTVVAEARAASISLDHHVLHLILHATLHLLGYDHELEADAATMERLEVDALASIGIASPYGAALG
ncbi:MAG: rRNA maturation RNase YbeY [Pseudomonadota bacterium]